MKNISLILPALAIIVSLTACSWHDYKYPSVTKEQIAHLKDGKFKGMITSGLDQANVEVTVEGGKIVNVEIIDIVAFGWRHEAVLTNLPAQVVAKQSLELDSISGATGSVNAFRIAASKALEQAVITQ